MICRLGNDALSTMQIQMRWEECECIDLILGLFSDASSTAQVVQQHRMFG